MECIKPTITSDFGRAEDPLIVHLGCVLPRVRYHHDPKQPGGGGGRFNIRAAIAALRRAATKADSPGDEYDFGRAADILDGMDGERYERFDSRLKPDWLDNQEP